MVERMLIGKSAAPGLARGLVHVVVTSRAVMAPREAGTVDEERRALLQAIEEARADVESMMARVNGEAIDMLAFQSAMLEDDELALPALRAIAAGVAAPDAWTAAMAAEVDGYATSGDATFAARTADLQDIRDRVLDRLAPEGTRARAATAGAVLVASDLTLSSFLGVDWGKGGAIVLSDGSPAGHVAMLARARGVPMVVGLGDAALALAGHELLVDATSGEVIVDPNPATRTTFEVRMATDAEERIEVARHASGPATTSDGTRISISLNISDLAEIDALDPIACDGIGLVRTEILFHGDYGLPSEEAQYTAYRRIVEWADGRPVVIRTLDAGGDKPIPGVTPDAESNPFLGLRGLRLSLRKPALFGTQLRALARAAAHGDLRVMLPMVTIPNEFSTARAMLDEVVETLAQNGVMARRPPLGIMIEVPAAAIAVDGFTDVDFFSIGSNDLTQYVVAAGRDIGSVAGLADPLNPAVLRLIESVTRHGRETGRSVGLCGDAAAEDRCIGPLLRAGVRSLSVSPAALGRVKRAVAMVDLDSGNDRSVVKG